MKEENCWKMPAWKILAVTVIYIFSGTVQNYSTWLRNISSAPSLSKEKRNWTINYLVTRNGAGKHK